jgi:hypothetical protein
MFFSLEYTKNIQRSLSLNKPHYSRHKQSVAQVISGTDFLMPTQIPLSKIHCMEVKITLST